MVSAARRDIDRAPAERLKDQSRWLLYISIDGTYRNRTYLTRTCHCASGACRFKFVADEAPPGKLKAARLGLAIVKHACVY